VDPEEGHKDNQRHEAHLLWRKAKSVGVVQSGGDKAAGTPYCGLPVSKGDLQERLGKSF